MRTGLLTLALLPACTCPNAGVWQGPLSGDADGFVVFTADDAKGALEVQVSLHTEGGDYTAEGDLDCGMPVLDLALVGPEGGEVGRIEGLLEEPAGGSWTLGPLSGSWTAAQP